LRQKQKKLIMLPSEIMIWQPEFTDKILSRKPGAVQTVNTGSYLQHSCDWGRQTSWSQMRMALSRSRTG
ncbi:TPA: hypothetical protein ACV3EJ_003318, partial [Escherichia coli]